MTTELTVTKIAIAAIVVPEGRRPVGGLDAMCESISRVGLLNPITVTTEKVLIAGRHRLESCRRLGWADIPAIVLPLDEVERQIAEIVENLVRNELTALERGEQIARLKDLYEAKHPETKSTTERGGPGRGHKTNDIVSFVLPEHTALDRAAEIEKENAAYEALHPEIKHEPRPNQPPVSAPPAFTADVAAKTGVSRRTVEREVKIGTDIPADVRNQIRNTPVARSTTDLLKLAGLKSDEEKRTIAEKIAKGEARNVGDAQRQAQRAVNRELVARAPIVAPVADERYQTIVLDPPWDWGDEGDADQMGRARPTYATMSIDDIRTKLPVLKYAAKDSHIYLWITNRSLPKGFALLEEWGFRYVTMLTWAKPSFGMGNYFRGSTEHVLFGVRGSLGLLRKDVGTWFAADRPGRHSAKPPEFYSLVESCSPGPWLEFFARQQRPGWRCIGAEVTPGGVS